MLNDTYSMLIQTHGKREAKRLTKKYHITEQKCPECKEGFILVEKDAIVQVYGDEVTAFVQMICTTRDCKWNPIRELTRAIKG